MSGGGFFGALRARWRQRGLREQLFLLFIVFSVGPLLVSNVWGYLQTRSQMTADALRNLANVAAFEASQTRAFVEQKQNLVTSLIAGNEHLFHLLRAMYREGEGRERAERALRRHLVTKAVDARAAEEFTVLSATGVLLSSSRSEREAGTDWSQSRCFEGRRRKTASLVGFEYGADEPSMVLVAPIREPDENLLGVFCARFRFDIHKELVSAREHRTKGAIFYLLDETGRVVCGSAHDVRHAPVGQQIRRREKGLIGGREAWHGRYASDDGSETFAAYSPIRDFDWGIFVEIPASRALSSLMDLGAQVLGFAGFLVAALALAVYLTATRLAKPLRALGSAAQRLAEGELGEEVPPAGFREADELAATFNRMSGALKESHDLLEQRIAGRTAELSRSQEFSELLLNSLDMRVVVLSRELAIIKANAAAFRLHGDDIVGKSCHEVFEGTGRECDACPVRWSFGTGRPVVYERSQETRTGQEIFRVEVFPIVSPGASSVDAAIQIGRVITADKRREAQMIHQEKMAAFGLLTAGIAHEIGNPLGSIHSQLRLAREFPEPSRTEGTLAIVEREVERIDRLLRELVAFTQRRRDEVRLVSLNQVVGDVARLLSHDPRARKVNIEWEEAPSLPGVRAREDHLVQVFLNLGINALDAMPRGGKLAFGMAVEDGMVAVRLRDTGVGIGADVLEHIFEPFFTTKEPGRGTGLGLFVSRSIVEGLGGRIDLESSGADGSVFVVRVPAGSAPAKEARS